MIKDKSKIIIIIIGIIILFIISLTISFIIAFKNTKTNKAKSNNDSGNTENITKGGTYKLTGNYSCVTINTTEEVELELNDANISCSNGPAINVEEAGELNITITGENTISATTTEDLDGAIYTKDDIVFSGNGSLSITSNYDGIVSKDSLTINGGTYTIKTDDDAIRGKDNVVITDGVFNITAGGDGIKTTNEDESEKGYINISGGEFNIDAADDGINSIGDIKIDSGKFTINTKGDGIHADGLVEINNGEYSITSTEGIEGTYIKINNGVIDISASDDGINATSKSTDYDVTVEVNGGNLTIKMGQGDTDAIDANGNIYVNGGTINITGQSAFDYDGEAKYNGGMITVNGENITTITNQMMGGMQQGNNFGGNRPSRMR